MAPIHRKDLFLMSAGIFLVLMQIPAVHIVQLSVLSVSINFLLGTCEASRFDLNLNRPFRFDLKVMGLK